jgi:WD40 repeat protein/serine/threonine protein kinase/cytochrome c-type biogenesis protein CcmH/NrfG
MDELLEVLRHAIVDALRAENWGDALPLLEEWCGRFPEDLRSWLNRGYCLVRLGRYHEAVAAFDRCLELDPDLEKARKWRERVVTEFLPDTPPPTPSEPEAVKPGPTETAEPSSYATGSAPDTVRGWFEGSVIDGRYDVRSVERGGMAVVAIAFDRELLRMVAVKTPLPSILATPDGRTRFQREAESWIALGIHPNICSAYYLQEIGGMPRLFMEYVDGGDLHQWLKRDERPSIEQRLDIAIQIASGLEYTHSFVWQDDDGVEHRGVIHRDIKPANVLLTSDGVARLTDFGLVRAEGRDDPPPGGGSIEPEMKRQSGRRDDAVSSHSWQTVTVDGGMVGTPPYMAPELWRQALRGTVATDVYAFGCMLYEIVCGRRPFVMTADPATQTREAHLGGWMRMHLRDEPPDPGLFAEGLHPRLSALMRSCVAKDISRRPQSFALLCGWLTEIYEEVTGTPYPRPKPERTQLMADSLNNRGVSYVTLDLTERAAASFNEALAGEPGHLEATYNSGLLEWRFKGLTDAEFERRLGEAERRTRQAGLLKGRWRLLVDDAQGAVEVLRGVVASGQSSSAIRRELGLAFLASARANERRDGLSEARLLLQAVVRESPSDVTAVVALARAFELSGDGKTASEIFTGARRLDAGLPETLAEAAAVFVPSQCLEQTIQLPAVVQSLATLEGGEVAARTAEAVAVVLRRGDHRPGRRIELGGPARPGRSMATPQGGRVLVACLENGPLTLFDAGSGERLRNLRPHPGVAICVAVSPDGRTVATGGSDRCLRLWNLESGECVQSLQGHEAFVSALSWVASTNRIVTGGADGTSRVWDLKQGRCVTVFEGHSGPVRAVAATNDGSIAVSGGQDGSIGMWDLASGANLRWLRGPRAAVTAVAFVDGSVAAGSEDGTVRLWALEDGSVQRVIRVSNPVQDLVPMAGPRLWVAHGSSVSCLTIPKVRTVALPLALSETVASGDLAAREQSFRSHLEAARKAMASGGMDEVITQVREARTIEGYEHHGDALVLWNRVLAFFPKGAPRSLVEVRRFGSGGPNLTACGYAGDGVILAGAVDGSLCRFDGESGAQGPPMIGHGQAITSIAATGDGTAVATASRDGTVRLWNAREGRQLRVLEGHQGTVACVAVTPQGEVVSAGEDGTLRLWPAEDGELPALLGRSEEAVLTVAVSADGRFAVSGGWDSHITMWSLPRSAELRRLEGHDGAVLALAISSDCRTIASGGADGSVRLWDLESGRCRRTLIGHAGAVQSVAFTPDARFVLSAGKDATLRVWDARTGTLATIVEGHAGSVADLAVDASGGAAVSVGSDSSLRLWFLDWEPEPPEHGEQWDDRVRPFLEVFLRRQDRSLQPGAVPTWTEADVQVLLRDLGWRGFGWIAPKRVERELELLARNRGETRSEESLKTQQLAKQRQREQKVAPAKHVLESVTRNLGLKVAAAAAALILIVLGIAAIRTPQSDGARFNDQFRADMAAFVEERSSRLHRGAAVAYQQKPTVTDETCVPERLPFFLDIALNAERQHEPPLDPGVPCLDQGFRKAYGDSIRCTGVLGGEEVVEDILARAGSGLHPYRMEDFAVMLVGIGEPAEPRLKKALTDYSEPVRHLAAISLVYSASPTAPPVLREALAGDEMRGVEGATFVLTEMIVHGILDESIAFDTVRRLCRNIDPRIRRNAVRSLALFERTGVANELLDEVLADSDPEVARAAEQTRDMMRTAKIQEVFGAD